MPLTVSILAKLKNKYPQFSFKPSNNFLWSSSDNSIYYDSKSKNQSVFLLHELSHALLSHKSYNRDINLITMERQAWDFAKNLASEFNIIISEEIIQSTLDSYRAWLHSRSTCPNCNATGLQTKDHEYNCLSCNNTWRVNEARTCALKRYQVSTTTKKRT